MLDVSYIPGLNVESIWAIAFGVCHLACLRIAGCTAVSEISLLSIAQNQTKLEELHTSGLNAVTDETLTTLAERARDLRLVDISRCARITHAGVRALVVGCAALESLVLRSCGIDADDIESLRSVAANPNIDVLL